LGYIDGDLCWTSVELWFIYGENAWIFNDDFDVVVIRACRNRFVIELDKASTKVVAPVHCSSSKVSFA
jgi:hypothetical protein